MPYFNSPVKINEVGINKTLSKTTKVNNNMKRENIITRNVKELELG